VPTLFAHGLPFERLLLGGRARRPAAHTPCFVARPPPSPFLRNMMAHLPGLRIGDAVVSEPAAGDGHGVETLPLTDRDDRCDDSVTRSLKERVCREADCAGAWLRQGADEAIVFP